MLVFIGGVYVYYYELGLFGVFNWWLFIFVVIGVVLFYFGSNVMNDYFDVKDGIDGVNNDYFLQFLGGSWVIEFGFIMFEGIKCLGLVLIVGVIFIGIYLIVVIGWVMLLIGLVGLVIGYLYIVFLVCLVVCKGLGELGIVLVFGFLVILGIVYVVMQQFFLMVFLIGLFVGLLIVNILFINEFLDVELDVKIGKNYFVVIFGKEKSIYIYLLILIMVFLFNFVIVWFLFDINFWLIGVSVVLLVVGILIFWYIWEYYQDWELVIFNKNMIVFSVLIGLLIIFVLIIG